ncbi:MAG: hypothetical protein ABI954_07225 [Pyrinomonadaceae bacterium]
MEEKRKPAKPEHILQFLTTEHSTLQAARSAAVTDANGRAAVFLSSVSSGVVSLAFIGQVSGVGQAFYLFALVLFPSLFFLGLVTFKRALQTAMEGVIHARGINRIRHYYTEIAPEIADYFVHSIYDDTLSTMQSMAIKHSRFQPLVTIAGTILVINSILAGVWLSLLLQFLIAPPIWLTVVAGAAVFVLAAIVHHYYQIRRWEDFEINLISKFPTPAENSSGSLR